MGFYNAKQNFRRLWRQVWLGVLLASRRVTPPPIKACLPHTPHLPSGFGGGIGVGMGLSWGCRARKKSMS